jgi:tetratricopeptide (TPR) repeat protein
MEGRKLALLLCVAASCAGCVTESKSVEVPPEQLVKLKNVTIKPEEPVKCVGQPHTWVAQGRWREDQAHSAKGAAEQNAYFDEARKAYQKAIDLDPKCVEAHIALARLYLNQEDYDRALPAFQRGLQQNPQSVALWFESGLAYARRKDFTQALQCLGKAHELDKENHEVAMTYGLALARAGRPQDAVAVLSRVMNKAEANYNVARMMQHLNRPDQARQYVQAALNERPTHSGSLQMLAQLNGPPASLQAPVAGDTLGDPNVRQAAYGQQQ